MGDVVLLVLILIFVTVSAVGIVLFVVYQSKTKSKSKEDRDLGDPEKYPTQLTLQATEEETHNGHKSSVNEQEPYHYSSDQQFLDPIKALENASRIAIQDTQANSKDSHPRIEFDLYSQDPSTFDPHSSGLASDQIHLYLQDPIISYQDQYYWPNQQGGFQQNTFPEVQQQSIDHSLQSFELHSVPVRSHYWPEPSSPVKVGTSWNPHYNDYYTPLEESPVGRRRTSLDNQRTQACSTQEKHLEKYEPTGPSVQTSSDIPSYPHNINVSSNTSKIANNTDVNSVSQNDTSLPVSDPICSPSEDSIEAKQMLSSLSRCAPRLAPSTLKQLYSSGFFTNQMPLYKQNFIPPQAPEDVGKYTIVLDMDETLLHSKEYAPSGPYASQDVIKITFPGSADALYSLVRPGARELLQHLGPQCELVLWTAGTKDYAMKAMADVDSTDQVRHSIYRDERWFTMPSYVKSLKRLGRSMERTILVDNSESVCIADVCNSLVVQDYFGDPSDRLIDDLDRILTGLIRSGMPVSEYLAYCKHNQELQFCKGFYRLGQDQRCQSRL